jgi:hypothetical protein
MGNQRNASAQPLVTSHMKGLGIFRSRLVAVCGLLAMIGAGSIRAADEFVVEPLVGLVTMKNTGQGIPGVVVTAVWIQRGAWGVTRCFHVESAVTDASGRYQMAGWRRPWPYGGKPGHNIELQVAPYAPDLQEIGGFKGDSTLAPFAGDRKARLGYLLKFIRRVECHTPSEWHNSLPALEAIRDEAASLVVDLEDKKMFFAIQGAIDDIRLGYEESQRLYLQRVEEAKPRIPPRIERAR